MCSHTYLAQQNFSFNPEVNSLNDVRSINPLLNPLFLSCKMVILVCVNISGFFFLSLLIPEKRKKDISIKWWLMSVTGNESHGNLFDVGKSLNTNSFYKYTQPRHMFLTTSKKNCCFPWRRLFMWKLTLFSAPLCENNM